MHEVESQDTFVSDVCRQIYINKCMLLDTYIQSDT